jgi:undecaprenyl diphosphate synthase
MDGNGRWAKARGLPRSEGHRVGADRLTELVEAALAIDLRHVSVYGFSTGFTPLTGQSCHNPRSRG